MRKRQRLRGWLIEWSCVHYSRLALFPKRQVILRRSSVCLEALLEPMIGSFNIPSVGFPIQVLKRRLTVRNILICEDRLLNIMGFCRQVNLVDFISWNFSTFGRTSVRPGLSISRYNQRSKHLVIVLSLLTIHFGLQKLPVLVLISLAICYSVLEPYLRMERRRCVPFNINFRNLNLLCYLIWCHTFLLLNRRLRILLKRIDENLRYGQHRLYHLINFLAFDLIKVDNFWSSIGNISWNDFCPLNGFSLRRTFSLALIALHEQAINLFYEILRPVDLLSIRHHLRRVVLCNRRFYADLKLRCWLNHEVVFAKQLIRV